jgi:uncharacterized protein (TIGR00369 family)
VNTPDVPEGFRPLTIPTGKFLAENGPIYGHVEGRDVRLGMKIGVQHANVADICHGGMSMTFADTQLVVGAMHLLGDYAPLMTINTTVDFVRPGIVGSWLTGETRLIRATRNLVFAEALLKVDGELAVRCSGILRRTDYDPFDPDLMFTDEVTEILGEQGSPNPPEGFEPVHVPGPFLHVNGPLHGHLEDNNLRLGLRIEDRHCNSSGWCHGGTMMMLADVQMGIGTMFLSENYSFMPTMHMSTDFAVPVRAGAWLVGETQIMRLTRNIAFSTCLLTVDGEPVVRSSSVNKRSSSSIEVVTPQTIFNLPDQE